MPALIWRAMNDGELIQKKADLENLVFLLRMSTSEIKLRDRPIEKILEDISSRSFDKEAIQLVMEKDSEKGYILPDHIPKMIEDAKTTRRSVPFNFKFFFRFLKLGNSFACVESFMTG